MPASPSGLALRLPGVRALPKPRRRLLSLALLLLVLGAGFLWARDSSFVAVDYVEIEGLEVGDSAALANELTDAAKEMTTLHFSESRLEEIARRHPAVVDLDVEVDFPHRMTIEVLERIPVAIVSSGDDQVAVAGDGVLLTGLDVKALDVPELPVEAPLTSAQALEGRDLAQAIALGEAPAALLPLVSRSLIDSERGGLVIVLDGGIELRFGDAFDADAKWDAAAAILADPKLDSLTYIDLRLPQRPAVGGTPLGAEPPAEPEPIAPLVPAVTEPATDPADPALLGETPPPVAPVP